MSRRSWSVLLLWRRASDLQPVWCMARSGWLHIRMYATSHILELLSACDKRLSCYAFSIPCARLSSSPATTAMGSAIERFVPTRAPSTVRRHFIRYSCLTEKTEGLLSRGRHANLSSQRSQELRKLIYMLANHRCAST